MTYRDDSHPTLIVDTVSHQQGEASSLDDINITVYPGDYYLVFGEHGSGKSLLSEIASGKKIASEGRVIYKNKQLQNRKAKSNNLIIISEQCLKFKKLTIKDFIVINSESRILPPRNIERIFKEIKTIHNFNIGLNSTIDQLSYNEKCVLLLIIELLKKPDLLIVDGILDKVQRNYLIIIFRIIKQMRTDDLAMLMFSNSIDFLLDYSTHVSVLKDKTIVLTEPVEDIERINLIKLVYINTPNDTDRFFKKDFYHLLKYNEAILENLPINLLIVDPDFSLQLINNRAKSFFNINENTGFDVFRMLKIDFSEINLSASQHKVVSKKIRVHNEEFIVNIYISPIFDLKSLIGYFIIIDDITDQEQMRETLQLSDKLATIGMLATGVAHEINNPLEILYNRVDLFRESVEVEKKLELLDEFEEELSTIAKITENLLTFSRQNIDENKIVDLTLLITEIIQFTKISAKTKHISIEFEKEDEQIYVLGNETELKQVFLNLIKNSMEAIGADGNITITSTIAKPDKQFVKITIADSGPGIELSKKEDVFLPFLSSKKNNKNTGLGLYNVYNILEKHNADISVRNLTPSGCEFMILYPTILYEE